MLDFTFDALGEDIPEPQNTPSIAYGGHDTPSIARVVDRTDKSGMGTGWEFKPEGRQLWCTLFRISAAQLNHFVRECRGVHGSIDALVIRQLAGAMHPLAGFTLKRLGFERWEHGNSQYLYFIKYASETKPAPPVKTDPIPMTHWEQKVSTQKAAIADYGTLHIPQREYDALAFYEQQVTAERERAASPEIQSLTEQMEEIQTRIDAKVLEMQNAARERALTVNIDSLIQNTDFSVPSSVAAGQAKIDAGEVR